VTRREQPEAQACAAQPIHDPRAGALVTAQDIEALMRQET